MPDSTRPSPPRHAHAEPATAQRGLAAPGALQAVWGVALLVALRALAWRSPFAGWWVVAVSVATWYVIDTTFSLLMGAWQNAVLNTVFLLCFAAPLAAPWRAQAGKLV